MQILQQGEYVGNILNKVHENDVFASVSTYNKSLFNDSMANKTPDAILLMLNVYKELVAADQFVPASIGYAGLPAPGRKMAA